VIFGTVENIVLDDKDSEKLYKIFVATTTGLTGNTIEAYPLDMTSKKIPVIGEQVVVVLGSNADANSQKRSSTRNYYISTVGIQSNINHNALPKLNSKSSVGLGNIDGAFAGVSAQSSVDSPHDFGNGFVELKNLSQLQPYLGDVIFEGRFGQSIRFGYTPRNTKRTNSLVSGATIEPSWTSPRPEAPITIIRNGVGFSRGYNKFVVEDINRDDSSLYLTSQQKLQIKTRPFSVGVSPSGIYQNPQAVLNSDRVLINSKKDGVLISGETGVYVSTPSWKADMDKMFTQIDELKKQVQEINIVLSQLGPALQSAANGGGPVPTLVAVAPTIITKAAQISGKLVEITTELQLMKN
jgi:hypothetical protein